MAPNDSDHSIITRLPRYLGWILGIFAAILYCIVGFMAISRSAGSTASIGLLFLPIKALILLVIFGLLGFCMGVILQGLLDHHYRYKLRFFLALIIIIPILYFSIAFSLELFSTYREVNHINKMNQQELSQAYTNRPKYSLYGYDLFILAAIAQNPNASNLLLDEIAHLKDQRINDKVGVGAILDLSGGNREGFSVIRRVVRNPNVSIKTLTYLTDSNNYYLLGDLAANPKLSKEILRKLFARAQASDEGYMIELSLAGNASTPPDILRILAKKIQQGQEFNPIKNSLERNPSTPEDVKKLL